jgi:hypothetical protein
MLDEGLNLSKRIKLIKKEVRSKEVTRGELLNHLTSLEVLLSTNPKYKSTILTIIRYIEAKLNRL